MLDELSKAANEKFLLTYSHDPPSLPLRIEFALPARRVREVLFTRENHKRRLRISIFGF
jgi:hypothetical protein